MGGKMYLRIAFVSGAIFLLLMPICFAQEKIDPQVQTRDDIRKIATAVDSYEID